MGTNFAEIYDEFMLPIINDYKGVLKGNVWETTSEINFVRPGSFMSVSSNKNAHGNAVFHIAQNGWTDGQRITMLNENGNWLNVVFDGNNFYDSEYQTEQRVSSSQIGSKIVFEYRSGKFFVVEKNGIWSTNERVSQQIRVSATEPNPTYYPMVWLDITNNKIKRRNENNTDWVIMS